MFSKLLIANRGEIAVRVARTCRELGIPTVAVYSTVDRDSAVVRIADEAVHIGPPPSKSSYLSIPAVIEAALSTGATAVHPGYGFLSEDPDFSEVCEENGLVFVGPSAEAMHTLGDKATTRAVMSAAGLPLLPGTIEPVSTVAAATTAAEEVGYPVILKAVAGGGGRGMSVVHRKEDLPAAFQQTRATAASVFGDGRVYLERFLTGARHVEVQVLCDTHGSGVYLGDRDCSAQRRHQKLVEEAPAPGLSEETRARMGTASVNGALRAGFSGAGTVEFLVDGAGDFFLMEMNARIQVEHPVTEMVTNIDLVEHQLRIAAGQPLSFGQDDVVRTGAAIECRINAEDPDHDFAPTPGVLEHYALPGGAFTRVDTHTCAGYTVPPNYDSLVAKLVTWGPDRSRAVARATRALDELVIDGPRVRTTAEFTARILAHPLFRSATHTIDLVDRMVREAVSTEEEEIMNGKLGLDPARLREILASEIGIDESLLAEQPDASLADLGLDSMALVELRVVLQKQHDVQDVPDEAIGMSFGELASHLTGSAA